MFEADFGGPHDGALCFNIVHHLTPEQAKALFAKGRLGRASFTFRCTISSSY
jgi:hypothetical protein